MVGDGDFSVNTEEAEDKRYYKFLVIELFRQISLRSTMLTNNFFRDISKGCSPLNSFKDIYSRTLAIVWKSFVID